MTEPDSSPVLLELSEGIIDKTELPIFEAVKIESTPADLTVVRTDKVPRALTEEAKGLDEVKELDLAED